jgi:phospholipid/cholesterol/gamma-HCH transport system ATP-binding protein
MTGKTVIEVDRLNAGYETEPILENISFAVRQGEVFVILGGSGCGKSTLLKHMIGLNPPLAGSVRIMGDRISGGTREERERAMRRFGVTYQSGALFGSMTLLENVCLPLEFSRFFPPKRGHLVAEMKLELVGLKRSLLFSRPISARDEETAAIARAFALDPKILSVDEPSADWHRPHRQNWTV